MKVQVTGFEGSQGVSSKTGKPYAFGQVHTVIELAPPFNDDGISKGLKGTTFDCDLELIQRIKHLQPPFMAEMTIKHQMRGRDRQEILTDVVPLERTPPAK